MSNPTYAAMWRGEILGGRKQLPQAKTNLNQKGYTLFWNKQRICSGSYGLCAGVKKRMIDAGTHSKIHFKIERHE